MVQPEKRLPVTCPAWAAELPVFDVRQYGATGDGRTLDTAAINQAIEIAATVGGGRVLLPPGVYLSFSLRLRSRIVLQLADGATLLAARPADGLGRYDEPEPNAWDEYQDFGHSHWHNSLIWGEDLEQVAILGPGLIHGEGLIRRGPGPRRPHHVGDMPLSLGTTSAGQPAEDPMGEGEADSGMDGQGNKAIAFKRCRQVTLQGFSLLRGGHFAVLATGVDGLTIEGLRVDTNRDGIDIDCCRDVHVAHCAVNSPNDDAIVLKSSFALGEARVTERVTITHCQVSGFDCGTLLDGSRQHTQEYAPDKDRVTGRIKLGTESNGGYRNIVITHCKFERCRGLALETVDGGVMEDITVSDLTMREVTTAPLFLRIGSRSRGPGRLPAGAMRRVTIRNVEVIHAEPRYASLICGIPGQPIEDVTLSDLRIVYEGGGTRADALLELPELEQAYPEPSMFGTVPAYGFFIRHARRVTLQDIDLCYLREELRPPIILHSVTDATITRVTAQRAAEVPFVRAQAVTGLVINDCPDEAAVRYEERTDRVIN